MTRVLGLLAALALPCVPALSAQDDVEMLGRIHGMRPPDAYYQAKAREPGAFRMHGGLAARRRVARTPGQSFISAGPQSAALTLGNRTVRGSFRFPVILGLFKDSPATAPFTPGQVQGQFFDGPNPTGTIPDLYREMSGGLVQIRGDVIDWGRSTLSQSQVTGNVSGLSGPPGARVGQFIVEVLAQVNGVDWGQYDNDGPDGVPNSGDDDGYVDVLLVMHPTSGAECGGTGTSNRIWSHKWSLVDPATHQGGALGQEYVTATPSAGGDRIRINDYTIQPVYSCQGSAINEIGVIAHELGHGFGLPDLYAPSGGQSGGGRWDLMAAGPYGCSAAYEPERPCPMGAWSKAALGWLTVETAPFGTDLGQVTLDPVETSRRVVAIPTGDGSGEYYLLENRQRIGFDGSLPAPGLLIWQIDPVWIDRHLESNTVNDNTSHMGVWLRQADGLNQLASPVGNRGDAGDPFPGSTGNTAFHAGTNPSSFSNAHAAAGVTITGIALQDDRVIFRALTRYQSLRVHSEGNGEEGNLFTVDGSVRSGVAPVIVSAPFQTHTIEAIGGASLGTGIRRGFTGWLDLPGAPRVRSWTTGFADAELVAQYGGSREVRLGWTLEGSRFGVAPGKIVSTPASPDLWFPEGTMVAFQAQATTGFEFRGWKGAFVGQPNPVVVLMDQPRDATATFAMVFAIDPNNVVTIGAATQQKIQLQARNANLPAYWTLDGGRLPDGLAFGAEGALVGAALEAGTFPISLRVTDNIGLQATGTVSLQVTVPVIGTGALAAPFLLQPETLTSDQKLYLDRAGNGNGEYDLGDLRAYVVANPSAPASAQILDAEPRSVTVIDMAPAESEK